jgi:hypothetical protein
MSNDARMKMILTQVNKLKDENPEAKKAFDAMRGAGKTSAFADEELGRALLGCLWELSRDMPDRLNEVLRSLCGGKTTEELFPDSLYETSKGRETNPPWKGRRP